uniref:RRM domain-containing protein n=2 Tax=Caenorhabditis tropicalis TaxID=1561998 RepID=A0A1I7T9D7_9PELO
MIAWLGRVFGCFSFPDVEGLQMDLKDQVRRQGVEPTYAEAHKRPNEALLCFATPSDLKRCIEKCDGMDLNGRKIKMVDDSTAGSGRSRSRSHSRSRSRSRDRRRSRSRSSSRSKSRSRSPAKRAKRESKSRSRSRSRSRSADDRKSRSPSRSPKRDRSASPPRRSRSPSEKGSPRNSRSVSPMENGDGDN